MGTDAELVLWINHVWHSTFADWLFTWVSDRKTFSFPLLGLLLADSLSRAGLPALRWWLILIALVFLGDAIGALLKDLFAQPRPCFTLAAWLRPLDSWYLSSCGSNLTGMPSNHALNFALVATFVTLTTPWRGWQIVLWVVALLVGISRIYLGKHYPSQVLVGFGLGGLIGMSVAWGVCYLRWHLWLRG